MGSVRRNAEDGDGVVAVGDGLAVLVVHDLGVVKAASAAMCAAITCSLQVVQGWRQSMNEVTCPCKHEHVKPSSCLEYSDLCTITQ